VSVTQTRKIKLVLIEIRQKIKICNADNQGFSAIPEGYGETWEWSVKKITADC